jgi:hypothetical protein
MVRNSAGFMYYPITLIPVAEGKMIPKRSYDAILMGFE